MAISSAPAYVANRLTSITIDCNNPEGLASFWSTLLDIPVTQDHEGPHLDIQVDDIGAARRQVEDLGGAWTGERHDYDEGVVMVMHDPEQNEFCLVQYYD